MMHETIRVSDQGRSNGGAWRTIAAAGILTGALDILFATTLWASLGVPRVAVLQSIASGIMGPAAFASGWSTAALGLALHFAMTTIMAAAYILGAPEAARAKPWLAGSLYGAALWAVMNLIVVPLSAAPVTMSPLPVAAAEIAAHIFLVGLPITFIARRRDRALARKFAS